MTKTENQNASAPASHKGKIDFLFAGGKPETFEREMALLHKAGYTKTTFVEGGIKARAVLCSHKVKFVVAEFEMDRMNGIELLKYMRRTPQFSATPFLLVSTAKSRDMVLYALDEAADGFLAAPYSGEDFLCNIIRIQLKKKSTSEIQKQIHQARLYLLQRQYEKAKDAAKAIYVHADDNQDNLLILSESLYRLRELDQAKRYLGIMLKRNPGHSKALHLFSKVCRLSVDCGEAFTSLSAAVKMHPLNADLKIDLGKFFLDTEMDDKAKVIFEEILSNNPTDFSLVKIGKAYLKKDMLEEAERFLNKTEPSMPETVPIYENFADKLAEAGRDQEAIDLYKKCLAGAPHRFELVQKAARLYLNLARKDEASECCEAFLQHHPGHPEISQLLSEINPKKSSLKK